MTNASKSSMGYTLGAMTLLRHGVIMMSCWFLVIFDRDAAWRNDRTHSGCWCPISASSCRPCCLLYHRVMWLGRVQSLWGVLIGILLLVGSSTLISVLELDPNLVALMNAAIDVFLVMAVVLIFVVSVDIFPSVVRSLGVFACYFFGRVGAMASPILRERGLFSRSELALLMLSFIGLLTALLGSYLPETRVLGVLDIIRCLDESTGQTRLRRFSVFVTRTSIDMSKATAKKMKQQQPSAVPK
ncbi:hypothetical protein IscW_ISCW023510 [Ixodes scapularis]|uniref:Uncharacterized protein n=1 Tax=Ixodes scapularis TaxID=6945 RepID=B7QME0_IXOSC|nr:hypothetical protein IscW_ISCW023510 [Ixodes scapularis]|eukprot:XP_002416345.1 hypothetical protein IscW_ISCW023510 [Ixodes scapularis]